MYASPRNTSFLQEWRRYMAANARCRLDYQLRTGQRQLRQGEGTRVALDMAMAVAGDERRARG